MVSTGDQVCGKVRGKGGKHTKWGKYWSASYYTACSIPIQTGYSILILPESLARIREGHMCQLVHTRGQRWNNDIDPLCPNSEQADEAWSQGLANVQPHPCWLLVHFGVWIFLQVDDPASLWQIGETLELLLSCNHRWPSVRLLGL